MKLKSILLVATVIAAKTVQIANADYIVGGTAVAPSSPIARSTVALMIGNALCTGSIIDRDLVVTAAHCVEGNPPQVRIIFATLLTPTTVAQNSVLASRYVIHPSYRMNQTAPDQNDIALVQFRGGLPSGYVPNELLSDPRFLKRHEPVVLAGFGVTNAVSHEGAGQLRATEVQIADESFGKTEVIVAQTAGHGACHGDSGGPAYLQNGAHLLLWGVTSRGYPLRAPDDCAHEAVYTNILEQQDFIRAAAVKLRRP